MIKAEKLTIEELKNNQVFNEIKDSIRNFIEYGNFPEARDLLEKLRELIGNDPSHAYKDYSEQIILLELLVFHTLADNEIINLFNSKLLFGLQNKIDIMGNFESLFIVYMDELNDFQLHGRLAQAIGINNELLGQNKIQIEGRDKLVPQTLTNWLKDFSSSLPDNKIPSYIEEAEFMNSSVNAKRLSEAEKKNLKSILRIYNYLHYPLRSIGEVKETGHKVADKKLNIQEDIEAVDTSIDSLESLKHKYNIYRRARWDVLKIEDEVLVQTKGDISAIKKELSSAAREVNKNRLIACVKILARQGYFKEALAESPAWVSALGEYIISKHAARSEPDQITKAVSELKQNYKNSAIVSEFLQYLLVEKLKISQNESALTAIEISQLLGKDYETIAYGNQETGDFEWTNIKVVDSRLVLEE